MTLKLHPDIESVLVSQEEIKEILKETAKKINADLGGEQ